MNLQKIKLVKWTGKVIATECNLQFEFQDDQNKFYYLELSVILEMFKFIEDEMDIPKLPKTWWQYVHYAYPNVPY